MSRRRTARIVTALTAEVETTAGDEDVQPAAGGEPCRAFVGGICFEAACQRVFGSSAMALAMAKAAACKVARGTLGDAPGTRGPGAWARGVLSYAGERRGSNRVVANRVVAST